MEFGEALSVAMQRKGMSANELAKKAGVTAPYISQLRSGRSKDPLWSKACAVIHALDMTVDEFVELQGSDAE